MNSLVRRITPLLTAVLLCHCGAPTPPRCAVVPKSSRVPAATLIADAKKHWSILADPTRKSEWDTARAGYNSSVAKLFDQLRCGPDDWESAASTLGTRIAPPDARQANIAGIDAVFPSSQVEVHRLDHRETTPGIGIPLVGWKDTTPSGVARPPYQLPTGFPYNLTATLAFDDPGSPTWHFSKRWLHNDCQIGKTSHTLASDWTAPNEFLWKMTDLDDLKIQKVLMPDRFTEETAIYFLQPYDPKKIPLVMVHGLVSSPDAFKNMINDIAPEPWFREKYQIWLYNYPTANPWIYSGVKFRELMREACAYARTKGDDHNLNRMVIVSHSMGGLITRSSVTDPKDVLYHTFFNHPIDQLAVPPPTRKLIQDATLYQPLTEPKRVVFLAVPHRGSPVANRWFAGLISNVIRLPRTLTVELLDMTMSTLAEAVDGVDDLPALPTSINSLSPSDRATVGLNRLPLPSGIHFHSVVGDRGRNDTPDSSDGIVPYWSSNVSPVKSELIVPCNHAVPDHGTAAQELKRILKLHLEEENLTSP
ncbi:MAG: esterase/lipase family protein [Luteolibacter sp.]